MDQAWTDRLAGVHGVTFQRSEMAAIADEYVLGLLEAAEAAEVEAEMECDAELRTAIGASRERFLPLDIGAESLPVNESLWLQIEAKLTAQTKSTRLSELKFVNDKSWKATAFGAIAATFLLAVGLAFSLMRTIEPLVIAVLVNEAGEVQAVVEDFGHKRAVIKILADYDVPADKTIQLWTLPSREMGPVSLGLIEGVRSVSLAGSSLPTPQDNQLYEITLEQAGGSPTGRPTGIILAKGYAKLPR